MYPCAIKTAWAIQSGVCLPTAPWNDWSGIMKSKVLKEGGKNGVGEKREKCKYKYGYNYSTLAWPRPEKGPAGINIL